MNPLDRDTAQEGSPTMSYRTASYLTSPLQFTRGLSSPVAVSGSAQRRERKTHISLSQDISYALAAIVENSANGDAASASLEAIGARTPNTAAIAFSYYLDDFTYVDPVGIQYLAVKRWH